MWPTVWRTETERSIGAREREKERERGRYTVCFVFLPSGPECESGFHCSFLVWVDDRSPSLPLPSPLSLFIHSSVCVSSLSRHVPRYHLLPRTAPLSLSLSLYLPVSRPFLFGRYLPVALLNVIRPIVRSAPTSPYTGCA